MENNSLSTSLSKKEMANIKKTCEEEILEINTNFSDRKIGINDEIDKLSSNLQTQIEIWIDHNLSYIHEHTACVVPLKTDDVTKAVINSIITRYKNLRKQFLKLQSPNFKKKNIEPFNTEQIIYIRQTMLPLVAEIMILRDEVLLMTKKIYKF